MQPHGNHHISLYYLLTFMFHINLDVALITGFPPSCALNNSDNEEVFVSGEFNLCSVYQLTLQGQKTECLPNMNVDVELCLMSCERVHFRLKCAEIVFVQCLKQ